MDKIKTTRFGDTHEIPKDVLLTQEEVDNLEDGVEVFVLWSGGNGPAKYEVISNYSGGEKWPHKYTKDDINGKPMIKGGKLDFIGKERPRTMVWLAEHGSFKVE